MIWRFNTGARKGITSSPAVADIDGDSKLEVMFTDWNAIEDSLAQTNIFWVLEDCTSWVDPYTTEWPMFRHDRCHTGKYSSGIRGAGQTASTIPTEAAETLTSDPHDVAIVFDWLSKTFIKAGEIVDVYVDVANQGTEPETTTVTVTYDGNIIGSAPVTLAPGETQTLTFPWDTTGVPKGTYSVTAEAEPVPGETDIIDNTFSTLAIITLPIHDIAVTDVKPSKTIVGQGLSAFISITIFNQGDYAETFAITAAYGSTSIGPAQVVTLNPSESTTIALLWNTAGVPKGPHTISAYIITPISGETDTLDNTLTDGIVIVSIPGDMNGDYQVNFWDLLDFAPCYGQCECTPVWHANDCARADFNNDGCVNFWDLLDFASWYGTVDP